MEEAVKDAIVTGQSDDYVLIELLEVTTSSIATNRALFANPLDEPAFFRRKFMRWVREGLEEKRKLDDTLGSTATPPA